MPVFSDAIDSTPYFTNLESVQVVGDTVYLYSPQRVGTALYVGFDASDLSNVTLTETGNGGGFTLYGPTAQYRDGNRLYLVANTTNAGSRNDLYVIDTSNPAALTIADHTADVFTVPYGYEGRTAKVASGGHLVTYLEDEIATIDISSPDNPTIIGISGAFWSGQYIGLDGNNRLYLGDGKYNQTTLQVYDVSNPSTAPALVEAKTVDLYRGYNTKVLVPNGSDTALIITNAAPVIRRVDISDRTNLRHLDDQNITEGNSLLKNFTFTTQSDISLSADGTRMYVVSAQDSGTTYVGGELLVFDISDTANITLISKTTLPSEAIKTNKVIGSTWYVLTENSFRTYTINPTTGVVTALDSITYTRPGGSDTSTGTRIISIVNNQAILMFGAQQVLSVDITDPANIGAPAAVVLPAMASYTNISFPYAIGNTLYMVSRSGTTNCRLYAINATSAASMSVRSSTAHNTVFCSPVDDESLQPLGAGQLFYAPPSGQRAAVVTIANPDAISLSGVPSASHVGLFNQASNGFANLQGYTLVNDDTVYGVSDTGDSNMYSIDISDITEPRPLDVLTGQIAFFQAFTLKHFGGHLYVGGNDQDESDSDFSSFSLANPDKPAFVGTTVHDYSSVYSIERKGNYMYTTRAWGGLAVYDISNPEFPVPVRMLNQLSTALDMKVSGDRLYVADQTNGLMTYDITDPANPVQLSSFTDVNFSGLDSIAVSGTTVYGISDGDNKVAVIDVSNPTSPATVTTLTDAEFDQLSKVVFKDSTLYVSSRGNGISTTDSVTAYDISLPTTPQRLGQYLAPNGMPGYGNMAVYQNFVLVTAADGNRVDMIDFDIPGAPLLAGSISGDTSLEGVNDLEIVDDRLYTISRLGQSINTYSLLAGAGAVPPTVTPTPFTPPSVDPPAITDVPLAPNAGVSALPMWPFYALILAVFIPTAAGRLVHAVRMSRR